MDMTANMVPIGQAIVVAETDEVRGIFTRISDQEGIIEYASCANSAAVLRMKVGVYDGSSEVEYMDQTFWDVNVDGRPIGPGEIAHGTMKVNIHARSINIITSN